MKKELSEEQKIVVCLADDMQEISKTILVKFAKDACMVHDIKPEDSEAFMQGYMLGYSEATTYTFKNIKLSKR